MTQANIERAKSTAGILLVGVGILLLRLELNHIMTHIQYLLGNVPSGMLPIVVMDQAQQTWQTSGIGFTRILQHVLQPIFVSLVPFVLVSIGMGLSTEFRR